MAPSCGRPPSTAPSCSASAAATSSSSGQDFSIGYLATADTVQLYLEETFTFRNVSPEAGIALLYND